MSEKAKEYFNAYHDSFKEVEARFEGDEFKSEADRDAVADELEQLYYMIADIDPSSLTLHLINSVIEMIENDEDGVKSPR